MGIKDHGLSIEEGDELLGGDIPAGRDDLRALATDLASLSAAYRHEVDGVDLRRWAAQAAAHARLIPSDKGDLAATSASNAHRPAPQAAGLPKRRVPVLNAIAAFVATTVGKTVVAGALVAATTTGGLAATGNLPGQSDTPDPTVTVVDDTQPDDAEGTEAPDTHDSDDVADTADDIDTTDACEADEPDAADDADSADSATGDCDATEPGAADELDEAEEADEVEEADDSDEADEVEELDEAEEADEVEEADDGDEADEVEELDAPDSADEG